MLVEHIFEKDTRGVRKKHVVSVTISTGYRVRAKQSVF